MNRHIYIYTCIRVLHTLYICIMYRIWVVVKIMVPFWVPSILGAVLY